MRILRLPQVEAKTGLKKTQIGTLEKRGLFPQRVKISERASGWVESEVDAYLERRVALARGQVQSPDKAAA